MVVRARALDDLTRQRPSGPRVVPIVADESRTFGMEGMFRQLGIYSNVGQLYRPQDADQLMWYREDKAGQILQEGITEAGSMCSWIASGTSYSTHGVQTLPFFIFYSMFGFQRIGDFAGRPGDMRTRGVSAPVGTSGRTTLRRRLAARGRSLAPLAQPPCRIASRTIRPTRTRFRDDRAGRHAPDARRAGRRLLLLTLLRRELPRSRPAAGARGREYCAHVTCCATEAGRRTVSRACS